MDISPVVCPKAEGVTAIISTSVTISALINRTPFGYQYRSLMPPPQPPRPNCGPSHLLRTARGPRSG